MDIPFREHRAFAVRSHLQHHTKLCNSAHIRTHLDVHTRRPARLPRSLLVLWVHATLLHQLLQGGGRDLLVLHHDAHVQQQAASAVTAGCSAAPRRVLLSCFRDVSVRRGQTRKCQSQAQQIAHLQLPDGVHWQRVGRDQWAEQALQGSEQMSMQVSGVWSTHITAQNFTPCRSGCFLTSCSRREGRAHLKWRRHIPIELAPSGTAQRSHPKSGTCMLTPSTVPNAAVKLTCVTDHAASRSPPVSTYTAPISDSTTSLSTCRVRTRTAGRGDGSKGGGSRRHASAASHGCKGRPAGRQAGGQAGARISLDAAPAKRPC